METMDNLKPFVPTLYIIMRSDIPGMNPGKGMAQAAHAQADFDAYMWEAMDPNQPVPENDLLAAYMQWCDGRNFGRTLVLSATLAEMKNITLSLRHSGLVTDPTYPWKNYYGETMVTSEITCAWFFKHKEGTQSRALDELRLHV